MKLNKNLKKNAASKMLGLRENNFWVVRKTMCDNKILGDLRKENLGCEKIYFYLYFVSWIKIYIIFCCFCGNRNFLLISYLIPWEL